jgi:hypothetical protein
MPEVIFEIKRADGLTLCNLNSLGGVWGGPVRAREGESAMVSFPQGKGLTMWMTYVCLGAHEVQTGMTVDGFPFVALVQKVNSARRMRTDSLIQVFFR